MGDIQLESGVLLKPIPVSLNDDYMAGSDGNVYSRIKFRGFGRTEYTDWYPLKGARNMKGYYIISLCHKNTKVTKTVHSLICMSFHGQKAKASLQVRHLDGNKNNNRPENLKWGTQLENYQDMVAHGTLCKGEKHWASRLTDKERSALRWALDPGLCSQNNAAKILGMAESSIREIANSKYVDMEGLRTPTTPPRAWGGTGIRGCGSAKCGVRRVER